MNWTEWTDKELPPLGALIQLKVINMITCEGHTLQGTVVDSGGKTSENIRLVPVFEEDDGNWGWDVWRARIVPMNNETETRKEKELEDV